MQSSFEEMIGNLVVTLSQSSEGLDDKATEVLIAQHLEGLFSPRPHSPWPKDIKDIELIKSSLDGDTYCISSRLRLLIGSEAESANFKISAVKQMTGWIAGLDDIYRQGFVLTQKEALSQFTLFRKEVESANSAEDAKTALTNAFKRLLPFVRGHNWMNGIAQEMYCYFDRSLLEPDKQRLAQQINLHMLAALHRSSAGNDSGTLDLSILANEVKVFGAIRDRLYESVRENIARGDNHNMSIDEIVSIFNEVEGAEIGATAENKAAA